MFRFLIEALAQTAIEDFFARTTSEDKARKMFDDLYKANVQKLIERNRRFEETGK